MKVLIGNKCELESDRVVSRARGEEFAAELEIPFLETSCKTNHNIKQVIYLAV
ncbi:Ras-related protein SEC4 [Geodia barretti]|uniref:Ras-related protein SEC4 n=1 Tax=Geodia barretti TaxID=519541 RepID=A0AA35RMX3_GEOBA|nr:Ras-related protein SEC4 [Geodia barretti]